jgi:D-alanine-D-alanine ligase
MENFGRVVLLMGGISSERDISLMSGEGIYKALTSKGVDVTRFDPKTESLAKLESGHFDLAFNILHGRLGEDGNIQGVLNVLGIPYTGPGLAASAVSIDKEVTKTLWRAAGIPVPQGAMLSPKASDDDIKGVIERFGASGLVVKPARDGSSIGVTKLAKPTLESVREALRTAGERDEEILAEEYIHGREFTVGLIDGKALPVIEIKAPEGDYDYRNKYWGNAVSYDCPAKLPADKTAELSALCEKAFRVLGCRGWSRIDVLQRPDGSFALLEINTSPGMTPHSLVPMAARAVGMDYAELCLKVLSLAQTD